MKNVLSFGDEIRELERKTGGKLGGKEIYLLSKIRQLENTVQHVEEMIQDRKESREKTNGNIQI